MRSLVLAVALLAVCSSARENYDWDVTTRLDEYINREDPSIDLVLLDTSEEDGATVYIYNLTSQTWMDETYIDRPLWWHYLTVAIPNVPSIFDTAHIFVGGGDNTNNLPSRHNYIVNFAKETGAVAARIDQVPNQPLRFVADPDVDKKGDALVARTWKNYVEHEGEGQPNADMVLLLPMTKAAKVAMDFVIEEAHKLDPQFDIVKYIPSGMSKRGWVAWLLACVDPRVSATCPSVLSLLNWNENFHHHYRSYGGWSFTFSPYWLDQISYYFDSDLAFDMFDMVGIDPLNYNPRLTMPKLLSVSTGDEFFLSDDTHYFWDELTSPKYMRLYENTGHGMIGIEERRDANIISFFLAVTQDFAFPEITWTRTEEDDIGYIDVTTDTTPTMIQSWWADTTPATCESVSLSRGKPKNPGVGKGNPKAPKERSDAPGDRGKHGSGKGDVICRRDFRGVTGDGPTGILWTTNEVEDMGDNNYRATYEQRADLVGGYRGFFVQMEFDGVDGHTLDLTTEVQIMPDTLPFDDCETPEECQGTLK